MAHNSRRPKLKNTSPMGTHTKFNGYRTELLRDNMSEYMCVKLFHFCTAHKGRFF